MNKWGRFLLIVWMVVLANRQGHSAGVDPVTITFGTTSHDFGNYPPQDENGYQYQSFGDSWQIIGYDVWNHGGDGAALFSFFGIFPQIGNVTTFRRLDGNPFFFDSVALRGRLEGQRNSVIVAHGLLDGVEVASQTLQSSNETWRVELTLPSFLTPIDELRLEVVEINGAAIALDNFVFAAVPEPSCCALLVLGLSSFAWRRGVARSGFWKAESAKT